MDSKQQLRLLKADCSPAQMIDKIPCHFTAMITRKLKTWKERSFDFIAWVSCTYRSGIVHELLQEEGPDYVVDILIDTPNIVDHKIKCSRENRRFWRNLLRRLWHSIRPLPDQRERRRLTLWSLDATWSLDIFLFCSIISLEKSWYRMAFWNWRLLIPLFPGNWTI